MPVADDVTARIDRQMLIDFALELSNADGGSVTHEAASRAPHLGDQAAANRDRCFLDRISVGSQTQYNCTNLTT